jgi:iron complex transport system substrate-binding protein
MFLWLSVAVAAAVGPEWIGPEATACHRVVSLAPSVTEILFALGAGQQVVGVTRYDDYPEAVRKLPKVGGFIDPDPEAVVALTPDLVVAVRTSGGRARIDTLARLGLSVLVVPAETTDDLWVAIRALGDVTGRAEAAASLTSRLKAELAAIRKRYREARPLRVLVVIGHRPLVAAGPGTYLDGLLGHLAAENVVTAGGAYPQLDLEATLALDPDAVIDVAMVRGDPGFWKRFGALRAVREGRVIAVEGESLLRPGPRLTAGLRDLGRSLRAQP